MSSPVPDLPDSTSPAFAAAVDAAAREAGGAVIGVAAAHIESGRRLSIRGGERFQMASVFKVPVAIATLGAVEKGALGLEQEVEIRPADRRKVGPLYDAWKPGMRVTVGRMVDVMLVDSDNTAADKLIALLGGPPAVEKALVSRGVTGVRISLDEKGMDAAMKRDLVAFERGAENGASPDAVARMLLRLYRGELLSRLRTDFVLGAMRRCATGDRRLRAGFPKGTEVLDKTGTVGSCANDAGIVSLPDGTHVVLAVFVRGGADAAARDAAIASVARAAWRAFAPEPAAFGGASRRASLRAWSSP
ncbi:MAG: class A beta-lactamase [Thermoanaerobaculia bacterium]|nr:class A beta-lactamase [Thermoanaerobaculia bacterium]